MKFGNKEFTNCIEIVAEYDGRIGRLIIPVPDMTIFFKWDDDGSHSRAHINDITIKELAWKKMADVIEKGNINDIRIIGEVKPRHVRFHKYFDAVKNCGMDSRIKKYLEKDKNVEIGADTILRSLDMRKRLPSSVLMGLKFVFWFEGIAVTLKSRNYNKVFIFSKVDESYRLPKELEDMAKGLEG